MRLFAQRPAALVATAAEVHSPVQILCLSARTTSRRSRLPRARGAVSSVQATPALGLALAHATRARPQSLCCGTPHHSHRAAHAPSLRHFSSGSGDAWDTSIRPDEIDFVDSELASHDNSAADPSGRLDSHAHSHAAVEAWRAAQSPSLPSTFLDIEDVEVFARPRMLSLVRRYRTIDGAASGAVGSASATEFETVELPSSGVFHSRLRLPVTADRAHHARLDGSQAVTALWAHGVANTAKDAELLAAMHAERMADLLGYHVFSLPSKQRRHAEAARQAGRYAPSPDDANTGPSPDERVAQWPLPLRRVLTDEETEGGKWQLVDTSAASRYVAPEHALLSPCLLDPRARTRIEAKFAASPGCPPLSRQLRVERVRTLTASNAAAGGAEFLVAHLALPPELTTLHETVEASGKATDRATAVLLACMHAELLLDALHVPLFSDHAAQTQHASEAWAGGRPAPVSGAKAKNPSHVHLPDPLKQLVLAHPAGQRAAPRSAEETFFHHHDLLAGLTDSFVETTVGEAGAVDVLRRFLQEHNAARATAPFVRTVVGNRVKSAVLLPLPDRYGIRGGVGVAAKAQDADTLAAMHALDVLCLLDIPVLSSTSDGASAADAAWKAARRQQIPDVPAAIADVSAPSPPARRCSAKTLASVVHVDTSATAQKSSGSSSGDVAALPTAARRRVVKRAKLASEANAEVAAASAAAAAAEAEKEEQEAAANVLQSSEDAIAAQLQHRRQSVNAEYWDLTPDSPDGYIMIAPGAPPPSTIGDAAIASPRKLDKSAKSRIVDYLATVGRRLEEVRITQALSEDDTEGRPRHRCALKVPLPALCGDPRLALGEGETMSDAEHAACMHAELMLDALGVCVFADAVKQSRHAEACAQHGRWAPTGPGQERPPATPSPPPLRREYAGSLHWERKQSSSSSSSAVKQVGSGFAQKPAAATQSRAAAPPSAPSSPPEQAATVAEPTVAEGEAASYQRIGEADVDPVARLRVQYYLRYEGLAVEGPRHSSVMGRGLLLHVSALDVPLPSRLQQDSGGSSRTLTAIGAANTRKDADMLAWMHAERLLDWLKVPLFPNLPRLQAYHAARAEKAGRVAAATVDDPALPLPPLDSSGIRPLRLSAAASHQTLVIPTVPTPQEAQSPLLWEAYVTACETYVLMKLASSNVSYFCEDRVPRTGDAVVDAALAEAEESKLESGSLLVLFNAYVRLASSQDSSGWVVRTAGEANHRVRYATLPLPGFEHVTAHGVGFSTTEARRRAVQHCMALYRRIDPDYEERYAKAKKIMLKTVNGKVDDEADEGGEDGGDDEFSLENFSTLPTISMEAQTVKEFSSRRHRRLASSLFQPQSSIVSVYDGLSESGKRRALELYALCCGLPKPKELCFVRLLPRCPDPSTVSLTEATRRGVAADGLAVDDPYAVPVVAGAAYVSEVSISDEEGKTWTARGSGYSQRENLAVAYENLFDQVHDKIDVMKDLFDVLRRNRHLRIKEIPVMDFPEAIGQRIQQLLRNQKDLLIAEREATTTTATVTDKEQTEAGLQSTEQKPVDAAADADAPPTADSEGEVAVQAAESAALLERLQQRITNPVYLEKFARKRAALSIAERKTAILDAIRDNAVVVICGTTGCGKTTQIPQYILDDATERGEGGACNIVVTQPRRISTISIASRVAAERLEVLGESTGYSIRFDNRPGRHINFVTTGLLLRMLKSMSTLGGYSHIIIDEIHERDLNTDFLLLLLRDISAKRPDLRIVLMSATLQASEFQRYFDGAALIQVEGYAFPVQDLFLEDLIPYARQHQCMTPLIKEAVLAGLENAPPSPVATTNTAVPMATVTGGGSGSSVLQLCYDAQEVRTKLDYPTICFAIEQAARMIDLQGSSILVFLPGWEEICMVQSLLERDSRYHVLALHSSVGQMMQMRCFLPAPAGKIKVVVSTNIAESGVTIDDVAVVIDCGRSKEKVFATRSRVFTPPAVPSSLGKYGIVDTARVTAVDSSEAAAQNRYWRLATVNTSRANCVQRRGRVGRTRPGVCIRLYSRDHFNRLHHFQTPEMQRVPLDELCLSVLSLNIGNPQEVLQRAISPPLESEVTAAMARLERLGAVTTGGLLTSLGIGLSSLPMAAESGKLLFLGVAFKCLDTALTLVAQREVSVFATNEGDNRVARLHRENLSHGTLSDSIASVNAYNFWAASQRFNTPAQVALSIQDRCLNLPGLLKVSKLKRQYFELLRNLDFLPRKEADATLAQFRGKGRDTLAFVDLSSCSRNALNVGLVKATETASCFPNVAVLSGRLSMRSTFESFLRISTKSVLHLSRLNDDSNPFIVYQELMQPKASHSLQAENLSCVSPWATLLMGPRNTVFEYKQELSLCVLSDGVYFRMSYRTLELIRKFKALFDRRLSRKFVAPGDAVNNAELEAITSIISELCNNPYRPSPEMYPTLEWREEGHVLSPTEPASVTASGGVITPLRASGLANAAEDATEGGTDDAI